jgi:hypothetical protein
MIPPHVDAIAHQRAGFSFRKPNSSLSNNQPVVMRSFSVRCIFLCPHAEMMPSGLETEWGTVSDGSFPSPLTTLTPQQPFPILDIPPTENLPSGEFI